MSAITITSLYDLLSTKLGKETAENLTTFIENKINDGLESNTCNFVTKEDLVKEISKTREELIKEISQCKTHITRWMLIYFMSQILAIFGFILLFIK